MWKNDKEKYKNTFSTREVWLSIRERHQLYYWHQAVWFKHATPEVLLYHLDCNARETIYRDWMKCWNGNTDAPCALCQESLETLNHLFFVCVYYAQLWEIIIEGVLKDQYTVNWESLIRLIMGDSSWSKIQIFITRYMIWRERNRRKHGESSAPDVFLIKRLDKNMR